MGDAKGWESVWSGPPDAEIGQRNVRWPADFAIWREEEVALPTRWRCLFKNTGLRASVELSIAIESGRIVCERFVMTREPGGPPVTTLELRSVPVAALLELSAKRRIVAKGRSVGIVPTNDESREVGNRADKVIRQLRPSKRPRGDRGEVLREVSALYREALARKDPAPRKAIGLEMGLSPGYVAQLLSEARAKGILGPATAGRAGEG